MPKVTQKGQVTIPREVRLALSVSTGDQVVFQVEKGKVLLRKRQGSVKNLRGYVGFLRNLDGKNPDEVLDELRGPANDPGC